jgi:hypothetical protein
VTACLGALGHDDVRPGLERAHRVGQRGHLNEQWNPCCSHGVGEGRRISEGQHDRRGLLADDPLQHVVVDGPRQQADAPWLFGSVARHGAFPPKPVEVAAAHHAQTAAVGHRRGQPAAGDTAHRGRHDRVVDLQ